MWLIILAIIGLSLLEYYIAKKTALGFLLPLASFVYLLYEYIVRHREPNFVFTDLLFQALLLIVVAAVWIFILCKKVRVNKNALKKEKVSK